MRFNVYPFASPGRVAGLLACFRRRAYVIGATQRGFFYRFGASLFNPYPGYFESVFGLRSSISCIDLMLRIKMRDEIIPISFRPDWIHGSIHFSRTGCLSFLITAIDSEMFPKMQGAMLEEIATIDDSDDFYDSNGKKRKQLDSY
jgi:hypothetical protein